MHTDKARLPKHIAIILDGNGRWAKKRHLPKVLGHREGAENVDRITEACRKIGIKALTLYSFSTENWKRSKEEVDALMNLLYDYLVKKYNKFQKNNIRLNAIGQLDELPERTRDKLFEVMQKTSKNDGMILTLALNYGGRREIIEAAKTLAQKVKLDQIAVSDITEDLFDKSLYTKDLPEVELMIRTSGEMRLSNFLLWQLSYSEIYVTTKLWPDFRKKDLEVAIGDYQKRERRYGA